MLILPATENFACPPSEDVAFQASDEYASRTRKSVGDDDSLVSHAAVTNTATVTDDGAIHVEEPEGPRFTSFSDRGGTLDEGESRYNAPILASDEVQKGGPAHHMHPAVDPPPEQSGSSYEMEVPSHTPIGRPMSIRAVPAAVSEKSAPDAGINNNNNNDDDDEGHGTDDETSSQDEQTTEEGADTEESRQAHANRHHNTHFPSRDVWEDTPQSYHQTATVSTPDIDDASLQRKRDHNKEGTETPQQAFARRQEALAEQQARASVDPFTDHRKSVAIPPVHVHSHED